MVKLHRVAEAEGDQPAVVDLIVSAPQADFTFTGMTHVYRDVWNRPPHTRSDIALRDANAGFNSPGKYGFDLDTVQVDDDGYLIAIGQPGFSRLPDPAGTARPTSFLFRTRMRLSTIRRHRLMKLSSQLKDFPSPFPVLLLRSKRCVTKTMV